MNEPFLSKHLTVSTAGHTCCTPWLKLVHSDQCFQVSKVIIKSVIIRDHIMITWCWVRQLCGKCCWSWNLKYCTQLQLYCDIVMFIQSHLQVKLNECTYCISYSKWHCSHCGSVFLRYCCSLKIKQLSVGCREYEEGTGFVTNPTQYKLNELSSLNFIATQILFFLFVQVWTFTWLCYFSIMM